VEALIDEWSPKISIPPNQRTKTISKVPRNSLIGWANVCRVATLLDASRSSLLHFVKRSTILSSAIKALIIRNPPKVSSSWDIVSLHLLWASNDWRLSFLPTCPISQPIPGNTKIVNKVSCQLVTIKVAK